MMFATMFPSYNAVYDGVYLENWESVLEKLENPVLLDIDINDYIKLKTTDNHKWLMLKFRNGGYDAGECPMALVPKTDNIYKPSRAQGVPRPSQYNMVVLDADDNVTTEFDNKIKNTLADYEYYIHATISSTKEKPKRRVLIPLESPIDLDVREAIIRTIAGVVGMECIDPACVRNKQMMCFPVHCKNSDNFHYHNIGKRLNAISWLDSINANWHNVETLPHWESEAKLEKSKRKRERKFYTEIGTWVPAFDKNRLHYAFNQTYRISDVLAESGKYTQTDKCRWSHNNGTCTNGIKVTNDAILYSYYGNDVLSVGRDLDAYETALILRYGNIADKENWKQMLSDVASDDKVKQTMLAKYNLPEDAETWAMLYDSTEEGIAQRCLAYFPHKIVNKKWLRYHNGIYEETTDAGMLPEVLQMLRIASALEPDNEQIANMVGKAKTAANILRIYAGLATNERTNNSDFEVNPWYLHFTDCVIDLEKWCKGEKDFVLEHSPAHMLTQSTGYAWSEVCSVNQKALDEIINAVETFLPDENLRNYYQMAVGRALTTKAAAEDKCCWLMGPEGGNGKTTMLSAIAGALGGSDSPTSYYYKIKGSSLYYNSRSNNSEAASPEIAGMKNRRFVLFNEYDGSKVLDGEKYKNCTSAGFMKARKNYSDGDNFQCKACCYVDSNGMPALEKRENSILRRTRVIPWYKVIKNANENVKNRWLYDHDIHVAMMVWLMLGLKMWYNNGCKIDNGIKDSKIPTDVYTESMSWYNSFDDPMDFFNDYYQITNDEHDYLVADECWEAYVSQVYVRGASRPAFRQAETRWLRQHGITHKGKRKIKRGNELRRECWIGVRLVGDNDAQWYHNDYSDDKHNLDNNVITVV